MQYGISSTVHTLSSGIISGSMENNIAILVSVIMDMSLNSGFCSINPDRILIYCCDSVHDIYRGSGVSITICFVVCLYF